MGGPGTPPSAGGVTSVRMARKVQSYATCPVHVFVLVPSAAKSDHAMSALHSRGQIGAEPSDAPASEGTAASWPPSEGALDEDAAQAAESHPKSTEAKIEERIDL